MNNLNHAHVYITESLILLTYVADLNCLIKMR